MTKKIQKIMAIRPDSQNIRDGVSTLSDFLGENNAATRRNLRTQFFSRFKLWANFCPDTFSCHVKTNFVHHVRKK